MCICMGYRCECENLNIHINNKQFVSSSFLFWNKNKKYNHVTDLYIVFKATSNRTHHHNLILLKRNDFIVVFCFILFCFFSIILTKSYFCKLYQYINQSTDSIKFISLKKKIFKIFHSFLFSHSSVSRTTFGYILCLLSIHLKHSQHTQPQHSTEQQNKHNRNSKIEKKKWNAAQAYTNRK